MEEFNVATFLFINQYAGKNILLDNLLITAAKVMPYVFILVLVYLWFNAKLDTKKSCFNAGLSVLLGMLSSYTIAIFYYHPRPFVEHLGTLLIKHAPNTSFPSDHATFIFCIAVMLLFNKTIRGTASLLCVLAFIGGFSRVFCGVHFPLDILGAILVAIFSSLVVFLFDNKSNCLFNLLLKKMPDRLR
ncbi:MAG: undecaprenyl-diphosphatase [Psychromonas sp.]|nr:undecaprenyl-diphosphatase [Psychromonas sp.]